MAALRLRGFLRSLHGSHAGLLRVVASAAGQKVKRTADKMAKCPSTATPCRYISCPATLPDCPLLTPYSLPPPLFTEQSKGCEARPRNSNFRDLGLSAVRLSRAGRSEFSTHTQASLSEALE